MSLFLGTPAGVLDPRCVRQFVAGRSPGGTMPAATIPVGIRPVPARSAEPDSRLRPPPQRRARGRAAPRVAHLAEQDQLSDRDLAEIEALLRSLKS